MSAPDPSYRVYCHDGANKAVNAEWVDAHNDEEAIAFVEANYPGYDCELWENRRLVAHLKSNRRLA